MRRSSLLVLGSSLTVMSGLRFVRQAAQVGKPVLIVNRDPTRGDQHALTRVALPLGTTLTTVAGRWAFPSTTGRRPDRSRIAGVSKTRCQELC